MQDLHDTFVDANLEVLLICDDAPNEQREYLKRHGIVIPAAFDPDGALRRTLGVGAGSSAIVVAADDAL